MSADIQSFQGGNIIENEVFWQRVLHYRAAKTIEI
jgi:hypothetical protein